MSPPLSLRGQRPAPLALAGLLLAWLAGCANLTDAGAGRPWAPPAAAAASAPAFVAPPRAADEAARAQTRASDAMALGQWWKGFDDPLLAELILAAQMASPDLAAADSRSAQARQALVNARAAISPQLSAAASAQRDNSSLGGGTPANIANLGLNASWEIDLAGVGRWGVEAMRARLAASELAWHSARVQLAADTANLYLALRACEATAAQREVDAASRAETARLTDLTARAGFTAPAQAALARAGAAQARGQQRQAAAACEATLLDVAALTAQPAATLRERLAPARATLPRGPLLLPDTLPASLLTRRADLAAAALSLQAAWAEVQQADNLRLPRLFVNGSLGQVHIGQAQGSWNGLTWSLGPVSLSLPLIDGGRIAAQQGMAKAAERAALAQWEAAWRQALMQVEQALLTLRSTAAREADAQAAVQGYAASLRAAEALQRGGLGSLFELEEARRNDNNARAALIDLQRERLAAWVALYQALGGGWQAEGELAERLGAAPPPAPVRHPRAANP